MINKYLMQSTEKSMKTKMHQKTISINYDGILGYHILIYKYDPKQWKPEENLHMDTFQRRRNLKKFQIYFENPEHLYLYKEYFWQ